MAVRRPIGDVLGTGTLTGLFAGFAAGTIDAIWSWAPAAQFVAGVVGWLRFVVFSALAYALVGLIVGLLATAALLVFLRATRLGDLMRFAFAHHRARQAEKPHDAD